MEITLGQLECWAGGSSETTAPGMHRRPEAPPTSRCIVEDESGVGGHPVIGRTDLSARSTLKAAASGGQSGSEMQAARMAPSMGRQLLRLGGGKCVCMLAVMGAAGLGTGPGLNPNSPQLAALCSAGAAPALPSPTTLCQWGRPGK